VNGKAHEMLALAMNHDMMIARKHFDSSENDGLSKLCYIVLDDSLIISTLICQY